ncbi:MAG: ABC transporter permease, partial [Prevotellaceae bacterium]|nr:ABC transporter permease [Prevotellaceae bacterium]
MKLIIKNFLTVLKRFKTSSVLNILGLAIAYAVFFMIFVETYYDFSFDRNFKKSDSIFLYTHLMPSEFGVKYLRTKTTVTEMQKLSEQYPEVQNFCYFWEHDEVFNIEDENRRGQTVQLSATRVREDGFADMFTPEMLVGDVRQAFIPGNALLTESAAKELFGDVNPIGKIFFRHESDDINLWGKAFFRLNSDQPMTVAAVCKDFPDNCSLKNGIYFHQAEQDPANHWPYTSYIKIDPKNKVGF